MRILDVRYTAAARKLSFTRFIKWTEKIYDDEDIVKSAQFINSGIVWRSIANHHKMQYKIAVTFHYLPQIAKFYISNRYK